MIFFFCFDEKVLMKSQIFLIIEHATSAKTYFSATKVWEKCALITAFVTENRKKGLLELKHLFVGSKLEILTFYWRVPRTTKCAGLLSKVSNFTLLLCLLTSYIPTYNIFGIFRTPLRWYHSGGTMGWCTDYGHPMKA